MTFELVFEIHSSANRSFPGGQSLILFQIDLFRCVEETRESLRRNLFALEAASQALSPMRIGLVFREILPTSSVFQGGDMLCLLQLGLFCFDEETHVSP